MTEIANEAAKGIADPTEVLPEVGVPDTGEMTAAEAEVWLAAEVERHGTGEGPERLPIAAITLLPGLFQMRDGISEQHLDDLVRALKMHGELDPLTVYRAGRFTVLLDGHHRAEAYQAAKTEEDVPVIYFHGTVKEAMLAAVTGNSKAKLPMSNRECQNAAWRLTVCGGYSKPQVSMATSVSNGQLGNMRTVLAGLGHDRAKECVSWAQARRAHKGMGIDPALDDDLLQARLEAQARDYAARLTKHFGNKLSTNSELAAWAFAIYFGRKLPELANGLNEHLPDGWAPESDDDLGPADF